MLAAMFSDCWIGSHKRDQTGRIFLDYNPQCFERLLRCLRSMAINPSLHHTMQPSIDKEHRADWYILLAYLGMLECMGLHAVEDMRFTTSLEANIDTDGRLMEANPFKEGQCRVAPSMCMGQVHYIKLKILTSAWIVLEVDQFAASGGEDTRDTCSGWSSGCHDIASHQAHWRGGRRSLSEHVHRQSGDNVVMKVDLVMKTISLWSRSCPCPCVLPLNCTDLESPFTLFVDFNDSLTETAGESGVAKVQLLNMLPEDFGRFD